MQCILSIRFIGVHYFEIIPFSFYILIIQNVETGTNTTNLWSLLKWASFFLNLRSHREIHGIRFKWDLNAFIELSIKKCGRQTLLSLRKMTLLVY